MRKLQITVPLLGLVAVYFVEHFSKPRYPSQDADDESPIVFPWVKMQAKLDSEASEWVTKQYLKPD